MATILIALYLGLGTNAVHSITGAPIRLGLDPSWWVGMLWWHDLGYSWGPDITFTYGPLGFVVRPVRAGSFYWLCIAAACNVVFPAILYLYSIFIYRSHMRNPFALGLVFGLLAVFVLSAQFMYTQILLLLAVIACYTVLDRRRSSVHSLVAGFSLAALALINAGAAIIGAAIFVVWTTFHLVRRQFLPPLVLISSTIVSFSGGWILLAGKDASLSRYVWVTFEYMRSYDDAMTYPYTKGEYMVCVFMLVLCMGALTVLIVQSWRGTSLEGLFLAAILFILSLALWKHLIVRQYPVAKYQMLLPITLAILGANVVSARTESERSKFSYAYLEWGMLLILVAGIGSHAAFAVPFAEFQKDVGSRISRHTIEPLKYPAKFSTLRSFGVNWDRSRKSSVVSTISGEHIEVISDATVDIWPWEIADLYAAGLHWRPRPTLQAYAACSSELDRSVAQHLELQGPEYILYRFQNLGRRNPMMVEPDGFRTIESYYDPVSLQSDYVLLRRRETPRTYTYIKVGEVEAGLDAWIDVPDGEDIYASLDWREDIESKLWSKLVKSSDYTLELQMANGVVHSMNVFRPNEVPSLYVSRVVRNTAEFYTYIIGSERRFLPKVAKLRLRHKHPEIATDRIRVEIFERSSSTETQTSRHEMHADRLDR